MCSNFLKKNKGFTLVEMLVAIAVFMIVMTVALGSLISIIDANKKAQSIKNVINNVNFALESISKDMRVGTEYSCDDGAGSYTGNCPSGRNGVQYKSNKNKIVRYRFTDAPVVGEGNIQRCIMDDISSPCNWTSLTAPTSTVLIKNMKFYVLGVGSVDLEQPRVIITIDGEAGSKEELRTSFNLQTTVSQRAKE